MTSLRNVHFARCCYLYNNVQFAHSQYFFRRFSYVW
nr:MAG TPA: hypothetical protein [Caudoviricetes sp.]